MAACEKPHRTNLLELFQSILPSLPYPVSPELGSP